MTLRAMVTTTITSFVDLDTMTPEHHMEIVHATEGSDLDLDQRLVKALALGGARTVVATLEGDEEGNEEIVEVPPPGERPDLDGLGAEGADKGARERHGRPDGCRPGDGCFCYPAGERAGA